MIKVGISSFDLGTGPGRTIEMARQAEAHGFHRFMLVEQPLTVDSVSLCAAIAAATERIGVGTGVVNIYLRSSEMLALGAAVAAEASSGRFVLGIGPNGRAGVEALGLTWRGGRAALVDTTAVVRRYLAGTEAKVVGIQARVEPCNYFVPIVWAAVGLGTADVAAQLADGVMLYLAPEARIKVAVDRFDTTAHDAGRSGEALERSLLLPVFLHDDIAQARAAGRRWLSLYARVPHYRKMFNACGFDDVGPDSVTDDLIDAAVLAGSADHCRDRLTGLAATGLTHVDLAPLPVGEEDLASAATRVMEALRPQ